jgi:hypothetical protein
VAAQDGDPYDTFSVNAETGNNEYRFFIDPCNAVEGDRACGNNHICQKDAADAGVLSKGLGQ